MITTIIIVGLACICLWLLLSRNALQRKLSVVESAVAEQNSVLLEFENRLSKIQAIQEEELTQDQAEYRDQLQAQYAALFKQIEDNMKNDLKTARAETSDLVKKSRAEFDKKLKDEFDTACEQIKFNEIEYKKTITKKRKEFNRKNSHSAKPQRVWRYIDEE
jgi:ABC-type bacteriocin/lantibiotic exporter with double-glycine peptidase domain